MPRRTIKTTANSRRGAKRTGNPPRGENSARAPKTKKSVSPNAKPHAATRRPLRRIEKNP